jgi:hypothetical protein
LATVNEFIAGLSHKKVSVQWMPCQLTSKVKTVGLEGRQQLCVHYNSDSDDFLYSTVKGGESRVLHCDPESSKPVT